MGATPGRVGFLLPWIAGNPSQIFTSLSSVKVKPAGLVNTSSSKSIERTIAGVVR